MRYLDAGDGDPVLLLHGIGHSIRAWGRAMPALAEAGCRALAIDTPGFGFSEQPPAIWGEDELVAFLDEFLDTFYLDQVSVAGPLKQQAPFPRIDGEPSPVPSGARPGRAAHNRKRRYR